MAKSTAKKRVKVKTLPTAAKKLTGKQLKKVKGGYTEDVGDVVLNLKPPKPRTTN